MIPIIINNRDLNCLALIDQCKSLSDRGEVHLIDNASTYPPVVNFLDWAQMAAERFTQPSDFWFDAFCPPLIHRWNNSGPRAACRLVNALRDQWTKQGIEYYATTDSDIDLTGVPGDVLQLASEILRTQPEIVKVGCALRLDDLPDTETARLARAAEATHWQQFTRIEWPHFRPPLNQCPDFMPALADIDTTFAVYRLNPPWDGSYGPSIRLTGRYQARHLPWYHTDANRPPDFQWYLDHADPTGTYYTAAELAARGDRRPGS